MLFRIIVFAETPASGTRKMAGFYSVGGTGEGGGGGGGLHLKTREYVSENLN